jgi:hypothetical protein
VRSSRVWDWERWDKIDVLASDPEGLPAGSEDLQFRRHLEQKLSEVSDSLQQVLTIVEDQEHLPTA